MFALQVLIVVSLVVASLAMLLFKAHSDRLEAARARSLAAAEAFAHSPGMASVLGGPSPTAVLQPLSDAVREEGRLDFVVVVDRQGTRYTHPEPRLIGKKFVGTLGPALAGRSTVEEIDAPFGRKVEAVVPVTDSRGAVVGAVASGLRISSVTSALQRQLPVILGVGTAALALATAGSALVSRRLRRQTHGLGPAEITRMYEHHNAVLHSVREGVVIVDGGGTVVLANDEAHRLLGLPPDAEKRAVSDLGLAPRVTKLLTCGDTANDEVVPVASRTLVVNVRPTGQAGGPAGSAATLRDCTELRALAGEAQLARSRLRLLYDANMAVGTTLDVRRTAEEIASVVVPRFADYTTVDLADAVRRGEDPPLLAGERTLALRRVAVSGRHDDHPLRRVGEAVTFTTAAQEGAGERATLVADLTVASEKVTSDAQCLQRVLDVGCTSLIVAPLTARGVLLGVVSFWRTQDSDIFDERDLTLAEELAAHAAVCIDNARRFTREHAMAVTLQRSLLPQRLPGQNALDIAHRYLPAQDGVRGGWFDVIPLSGTRVALVVGDVVGQGLHAAATMGRLRTAVQNFSSLDLAPDELLGRLDEIVARIDQESATTDNSPKIAGASCLYAIYDPVSGSCALARAGHQPPAVVRPDGTVDIPELPDGPPLGMDDLPFEAVEMHLPEGSSLVFYTDGLVADREHDVDEGLDTLRTVLARHGRGPQETCEKVLSALPLSQQSDDTALLVARTRRLSPDRVANWELPSNPAAVAGVRADISRQLERWGLEDKAFTTELVLSELITNAIRYAPGRIGVRLLHDRALVCEVSDSSSTSPHLRYASDEDEGGRGLFLIAHLADRWGTRYTAQGKVIWAEQRLV
ncbi:SpoIIE family protein phosphatase [Streptomyces sp. RPT161]|uniref:SpoIIE family protein phosphatase n=1 Tax=Streptomyces sp. RPT161 TaxID=3015993 RepID=UPI0022B9212A|nr:SpoIIE family protein phosphatase [Streptomyces sp. RPT161]